uniref:Uncharacterized protein n=1 Tax=Anopheles stephensi TaxID=30069 RepID=A0A182XY01_ANOST
MVHSQNTAPEEHHQYAVSGGNHEPEAPTYRMHAGRECGKCKISTKRLNLNKFCKRDYDLERHKWCPWYEGTRCATGQRQNMTL